MRIVHGYSLVGVNDSGRKYDNAPFYATVSIAEKWGVRSVRYDETSPRFAVVPATAEKVSFIHRVKVGFADNARNNELVGFFALLTLLALLVAAIMAFGFHNYDALKLSSVPAGFFAFSFFGGGSLAMPIQYRIIQRDAAPMSLVKA